MLRVLLLTSCLTFSLQVNAQGGDSILEFFDNIFGITDLINGENKDRLKRELGYYAQNMDELIKVKKDVSKSMLKYCDGSVNQSTIEKKFRNFNKYKDRSIRNLEKIRKNILFESDYNIVVDTIYQPTPLEKGKTIDDYGEECYLQVDTNYIRESYIPEGYDMMTQNNVAMESRVIDTTTINNVYCPSEVTSKKNTSSWKTISFDQMIEGYTYSLNVKSNNLDYLLKDCNKLLIIQERKKAIGALTQMRDKALELKQELDE